MSWIDEIGYPWHIPVAQQVHLNLIKAKPAREMAMYIAGTAGIETAMIDDRQAIFFLWKNILEQASAEGQLRDLLNEVVKQLKSNHPMMPFFEGILKDGEGPVEAEPVKEDGTPNFLSDDDTITEEEALLFREDLTIQIGKLPSLIEALERLVRLAPCVCRMVIDVKGSTQYGTGFRIGAKTVLTNHHVLHSKHTGAKATAVSAQFGYEDDGSGGLLDGTSFKCDVQTIQSNKQNDWAIIVSEKELPDSIPIIDLSKAATPVVDEQAFIVQHPLSGTKRVGYVRNTISNVNDQIVHYLTDTQEGSSGAPVFNEKGQLIAIHHAGGQPIQLAGKTPMKKNEGIRISKILEDFASQNVQVV